MHEMIVVTCHYMCVSSLWTYVTENHLSSILSHVFRCYSTLLKIDVVCHGAGAGEVEA
jgi:hypothetical protein